MAIVLRNTSAEFYYKFLFFFQFLVMVSSCSHAPAYAPDNEKEFFLTVLKKNPSLIWVDQLSPRAKKAIQAYETQERISEHEVYGQSVRQINLENKTLSEIEKETEKFHCKKKMDYLKNPKTKDYLKDSQQQKIPLLVYLCPDGGVVRLKPKGDPTSRLRPQPHGSKALRYPADASFESFDDEMVKVDSLGYAIPKWPKDMKIPLTDPQQKESFIEGWAEDAHTDLMH